MKRLFLSMLTLLVAVVGAEAKNWKIGPSSVSGMNFASINAAMSSTDVKKGDTLYLDQFYNEKDVQIVNKRVVIIGTGYDTTQTDEQVVACLTGSLDLKVGDVIVKSVKLNIVNFYNENCTIDRCYANAVITMSSTAGKNNVYSSYIDGYIQGYNSSSKSNIDIQNCVILTNSSLDHHLISYFDSSVIKNNTIIRTTHHYAGGDRFGLYDITNSQIIDNIILYTNGSNSYQYCMSGSLWESGSGNAIEHNITSTNNIPTYPTNKTGFGGSSAELFTLEGNFSDYYELAEKSAALGYATDGGEVGCHGGMFGCPSGGRPQYIPYFTKVIVGSRTEDGKLPVKVTIKIQDE